MHYVTCEEAMQLPPRRSFEFNLCADATPSWSTCVSPWCPLNSDASANPTLERRLWEVRARPRYRPSLTIATMATVSGSTESAQT